MSIMLDPERNAGDYHFPVDLHLAQNLLGVVLTHLDAIGMPDPQAKAVKDLVRQSFWRWWDTVKENSVTSYRGCLAPIVLLHDEQNGTERKYVWMVPDADHAVSVNI